MIKIFNFLTRNDPNKDRVSDCFGEKICRGGGALTWGSRIHSRFFDDHQNDHLKMYVMFET